MSSSSTSNFEALRAAVLSASDRKDWHRAVDEWEMVGLEEDPNGTGVCICGQRGLVHLFTIRNTRTGAELYPIGSSCINHFERADLNASVTLLGDLSRLKRSLVERTPISFNADHFSRAMLEYFYEAGVFTPDRYNFQNGEGDWNFLLDMFNKHNKNEISAAQKRKIRAIVERKIVPFVKNDQRIR